MAAKKSKHKWQDTSSYSSGEAARVPNEFRLELKHSTLVLHRKHGYHPDQWWGTCHHVGIVNDPIGQVGMSADQAKAWLLELCIDQCAPRLNELVAARG